MDFDEILRTLGGKIAELHLRVAVLEGELARKTAELEAEKKRRTRRRPARAKKPRPPRKGR